MRLLVLLLALLLALPSLAAAHEVRPAYIEITERGDGHADVLWKQPSAGMLVVPLRPRLSGGLIDRKADRVEAAQNFEVRHWDKVSLGPQGLNGREVRIDGLDKTITDTLLLARLRNGDSVSHILTPAAPALIIDAHAGAAVPAYLVLGIEHILTGIDHLLFVFGLLLLSTGWRQLLRTITAFIAAHSITLALSALKVIALDPGLVEAMVAWSILFLAVELVHKARGEDGQQAHTLRDSNHQNGFPRSSCLQRPSAGRSRTDLVHRLPKCRHFLFRMPPQMPPAQVDACGHSTT